MAGNLGSALNTAVAGLQAQSKLVATAADNLANMTTAGYKRKVATVVPRGVTIPDVFLRRDASQGAVVPTGNPYDLALSGRGYFEVTLGDGRIGYTRAGTFGVSAAGVMTDQGGNTVVGPLTLDPAAGPATVASDGTVTQVVGGAVQVVGRLETAVFPGDDPSGTPGAGVPGTGGRGTVVQGALESSNVEPVQEVVGMMLATHAYKASARVIRTVDELMGELLKKV